MSINTNNNIFQIQSFYQSGYSEPGRQLVRTHRLQVDETSKTLSILRSSIDSTPPSTTEPQESVLIKVSETDIHHVLYNRNMSRS